MRFISADTIRTFQVIKSTVFRLSTFTFASGYCAFTSFPSPSISQYSPSFLNSFLAVATLIPEKSGSKNSSPMIFSSYPVYFGSIPRYAKTLSKIERTIGAATSEP